MTDIKRMTKWISISKINMTNEENLNFRLTKIDEKRNFLLDEIKHDLMSEKYKKTCKYLNYIKHLLILTITSTITGCLSISAFASLVHVPLVLRVLK